jgi:hypothetical protein
MTTGEWQQIEAALRNVDDIDAAVAAANKLQTQSAPEDVHRLRALLGDDDFFVREAAAWALSDLGCTDALPELLAAFQRGFDEGYDNDGFTTALSELVFANPIDSKLQLEVLMRGSNEAARDNVQWLLEFCNQQH